MSLSYDLISEFVKITNDKKENTTEGTVYATVVSGTGGKYVKIDGSDLLTPMDTTADIEDGERVTLMIKDHKAIVTGNVTNPSASTSKVDKVTETVNSVSDRVGTFELVIADKVNTKELEAYKATIEVLIAGKATIEDLTATNAKVENLEVKNAQIENLVAEKANITDLNAVNATIENLKVKDAEIEHAVVENLKATTADINILNADFAEIKTLVNGNLTSDNILSFNLTSEKVTVDNAFIKDAMIDTISAGKINAGKINTNSVSIGSEDGGMLISGSTQQFTDKNGNVRIQIGKDASGDFTFVLYGEDGTGQIINQNGITASAIGDGLIVNNMVSDNAAIAGGKLDISSVITEINGDTSTTIKSSKIYLNEQQQSLEVAFNTLKTKVDTIQEITIEGDLTAIVEQVQSNTTKIEANTESISTLISEDTIIKKQVTDLEGTLNETETTLTSQYTSLNQSLEGFKTTVADTYATKSSVTDVVDNLSANYSTTSTMDSAIEQKAQEISASVSSTYATKNEVNTLDNILRTNYSTTQQMESAINVAKEAVTTTVSNLRTEVMSASYNNLLWNSDFLTWENDFPKGYYSTNRTYCFGGGWICPEGGKTITIDTSGGGVNWQGFTSSMVRVRQDQTLTASVYVAIDNEAYRGTVNFGIEILWLREDGSRITQSGNPFTIDTIYNWERQSVTGTAPEGTVYAQVYCWNQDVGCSWWGKPMLQFGSVMTAWTRGGDFERVDERLSYAETKITDDAITNTVKQNFYTKQETENAITTKGYATSSQVQQTADSLTATFTKSGGCNLFRNSGFKCPGDTFRHWYVWNHKGLVNSGNFEINRASDAWGFPSYVTDSMVIHVANSTGDTYVEYGRGQTIDTTVGQTYTVSCYYAMHRVTSANIVVRNGDGQWIATQGLDTSKTGGNGNVGNWGRATLTFTATGNRHSVEFMLHGVTSANNGYMWIVQPMCNEGSVAQPYSVHPNEAYDGVIMMDYEGIKVSATGFGGYTHMTKDGFYLNNGSTDVFYVNGDGLKIGSNPSTSINGDVIRSGNIVANNGDLTFNLNSGQMHYKYAYNQVGFLGVTDGNAFSLSTDAKGWCMNSDYGSFSSMGAKSVNGGNYVPYLTVTSGGVSNYNAGIFMSMPLNYGSATGINMTVKSALELSSKVNGAGLFNPKIAWRGTDVVTGTSLFPRSAGDRIDIYSNGDSSTSNLIIRLADDVNTYFKVTCNHYTYGHQAICTFRYVTSTDGYGIDFYRGLNMHNYNLGNVSLKNAKSVQTASLALLDDVATVQTASPTAMYALDNGIEATQATITQHIATSINKTVTFNGTELVEGTSEYIELPQDFLMCVDIQVTLTPNKLCRFAVTSKDEFGFVIETDTEGVTFDYVVIGTKMDGTLFASLHEVEPDTCPINDEEEEIVKYTTDNIMLPQELIDKGYTTFADATEEEMEAMRFEQVFGSPVRDEVIEKKRNYNRGG